VALFHLSLSYLPPGAMDLPGSILLIEMRKVEGNKPNTAAFFQSSYLTLTNILWQGNVGVGSLTLVGGTMTP